MSNDRPPVSIYIITHLDSVERGAVLKAVCENALALNYPEFEVVVSDNAGSVPAEQILSSIIDARLKIFRNSENLGFAGNMNCCLERCQYDIIKLNCDDDLLHPDFLNCTVPYVDDETFVVTDYEQYVIGTDPESLSDPVDGPLETAIREPGYRYDFWKFDYISLPGCTLFTRKLFSDLGAYNSGSSLPDWDVLMEARLCCKVLHVKKTLCYMGIWAGSITQQMLDQRPYFFSKGSLFTYFRILYHEKLTVADRRHVRGFMFRKFCMESLRMPKNFYRRKYWSGYFAYAGELFSMIIRGRKLFGDMKGF